MPQNSSTLEDAPNFIKLLLEMPQTHQPAPQNAQMYVSLGAGMFRTTTFIKGTRPMALLVVVAAASVT